MSPVSEAPFPPFTIDALAAKLTVSHPSLLVDAGGWYVWRTGIAHRVGCQHTRRSEGWWTNPEDLPRELKVWDGRGLCHDCAIRQLYGSLGESRLARRMSA